MPVLSTRCRAIAVALALPFLLAPAAAAQGQADKDLKAISAYTFTLPKYKQLMTAMVNLGNAAKADPKVAGALEGSGNLSLDEMTMRLQSLAPARKAIVDAGLTPRELAVEQGAWLQSGMSYGLMKQYNLTADSVSKATGASKANLEFFRANEAELQRIGKAMEAQMPKDKPTDEADEASEPADSAE